MYTTTDVIEHRARYRLKRHGLRLHKQHNDRGEPMYYISEIGGDQSAPADDDFYRWHSLNRLLDYVEELAAQDAEYYAECRAGY